MKTILITGAAGELGTVVTDLFVNKGYKVIATVHNPDSRNELDRFPNLHVEVIDLSNAEMTEVLVKRLINEYTTIDAALLLVGGFSMGDINNTSIIDLKKQISLNFETAYNVIQPLFQHMLNENSGRIIVIGSRPGLDVIYGKNMLAYTLSKSMLTKLAELLNQTARGKNVTVTLVAPSIIDTEANRKSMPEANTAEWVKPEALAELFHFICSDTSAVLRETVLKAYNNA